MILGQTSNREDGRLLQIEKFDPNIRKISHDNADWVCSKGTNTPNC